MRILPIVILSFIVGLRAAAAEFKLENDVARLVLSSDGSIAAIVDKATGRDWAGRRPASFMAIRQGETRTAATAMTRHGDLLEFSFGLLSVRACLRITAQPRYFLVELVKLEGEGTDEVQMAAVPIGIKDRVGGMLNVRWNDAFAICLMGLSDRVNAAGSTATVYRQFGMEGQKAAILAVPTPKFYEVVQEVERDHGLPSPTLGRMWAKISEDVRRG